MTRLVLQRLTDDSEFETIGVMEDGEFLEGEEQFRSLLPAEQWRERDPQRLAAMFSGPEVVLAVQDEEDPGDGDG